MIDFVNIIRQSFRDHKSVYIIRNSDKAVLNFDVYPYTSIDIGIDDLEINTLE